MKVNVYPADEGGCGAYRMRWPAEALAAQGAEVEVIGADQPEERQIMATWHTDHHGERRLIAVRRPDADVVVIQRPLTDTLSGSIRLLQDQGVVVVVEIDDDFEAIHPRNVSWSSVHPRTSPRRNWEHLRAACAQADHVVVSTPALARRYGRHGRVSIVPNLVPERYLSIEATPNPATWVGWSGSVDTHPDDLQQCGPAVVRTLRSTGARMAVVGTGRGVGRALGLDDAPVACGWQPLEVYPEAVAQFDVGIVPLADTAFNQAKSWLKGLEYAALGVPFVASPTEPYRSLVALGAGELATRPKDWERALKRLVVDEGWRAERAAAGREVAAGLTIEAHCERWWEAWTAPVNALCAS